MQDKTELNPTAADVQKLQEENRRLVAYTEELEFETSRNYCRLTNEIRDLKAANRDLSQKYEFSDSHYQMTLRHADNLQAILDDSRRTICDMQKELNYRDLELLQARRHADNLQQALDAKTQESLSAKLHRAKERVRKWVK